MGYFTYQYPKQILTMINEKCPGVAINTEEYTTYGFRNCLGCILKNSFSFNGPIISELGKEISTADVYAEYCEEREKVTLDDLKNILGYEYKHYILGVCKGENYTLKPDKIVEDVSAIDRGCKVYDALTKYLRQMPNEKPGTTILYYNTARNVLFSLLIANGLMSKEELEKEFEHNIGSKLYDDIEWIYEQADIFKNRYDYKLRLVEEENIKFREKMKKLHDKE